MSGWYRPLDAVVKWRLVGAESKLSFLRFRARAVRYRKPEIEGFRAGMRQGST